MGINAMKGSFGVGLQSEKAKAAAAITYIQASSVSIGMEQNATSLPAEVGGRMWSAESYKTGVMVAGDASFNVRANTIGILLRAFAGSAVSAPEGSANKHVFTEADDVSFLPWMTLTRNTSDVWTEQYVDCRVDSMRLDVPAAGIVTGSFGFVGITPSEIENPVETWDDSPLFETCTGAVLLEGVAAKVTRVSFDFGNGLSRDEQIVGSYFLDDITMVRRTCRVTIDTFLKDAALYRKVYNNGTGAWDPQVYSASLEVTIGTARHIVDTTHGEIKIKIPNIDLLTYPVALAGNDIVRVSMSAELTLGATDEAFSIELINMVADYTPLSVA
jgi:hypothetical protein